MNKLLCFVAGILISLAVNAQKERTKNEKKLGTLKDSASYAMGYSIGQTLSANYPGMELDLILKGLADAFIADTAAIKSQTVNSLIKTFLKEQAKIQEMTNREAGEKFFKRKCIKGKRDKDRQWVAIHHIKKR